MASKDLDTAKKNKADEFYTQLVDIELEMKNYRERFRNKIVFCNCDDPYESNFFKYFALNFNKLGLKKLITTCYSGSPIMYEQVKLLDVVITVPTGIGNANKHPYKVEITEVKDENNDGAVNLADVEYLLKSKKNVLTLLDGNGDFRSEECIELLNEADIVVTNPPFSLFREYVAQLVDYNKKFIIVGNINAVTYKEIFKLIKENKIWLGQSIHSGDREFRVPESYPLNAAGYRVDKNGHKYIRVKGVRWYTNLDYKERHIDLTLFKKYSTDEYPKYDNYDAIEVSKTANIPYNWSGYMGVPITFLDKYNPEQFEIVKFRKGDDEKDLVIGGKHPYFRILIKQRR